MDVAGTVSGLPPWGVKCTAQGPKKKGARFSLEAAFQPALGFVHVLDVGFIDQQIRLAVAIHLEAAFVVPLDDAL